MQTIECMRNSLVTYNPGWNESQVIRDISVADDFVPLDTVVDDPFDLVQEDHFGDWS